MWITYIWRHEVRVLTLASHYKFVLLIIDIEDPFCGKLMRMLESYITLWYYVSQNFKLLIDKLGRYRLIIKYVICIYIYYYVVRKIFLSCEVVILEQLTLSKVFYLKKLNVQIQNQAYMFPSSLTMHIINIPR